MKTMSASKAPQLFLEVTTVYISYRLSLNAIGSSCRKGKNGKRERERVKTTEGTREAGEGERGEGALCGLEGAKNSDKHTSAHWAYCSTVGEQSRDRGMR